MGQYSNLLTKDSILDQQFLYFVVVNGNKDLLKKEIEFFHPNLRPSFSKGDFLTYKNSGPSLSDTQLSELSFAFALEWGISETKLSSEFIDEKLKAQIIPDMPSESPSRAWLKIAQACEKFKISRKHELNWIEFGSSPGGASYYLLSHFGELVGVDPASMDALCFTNPRFTHVQKPIQNMMVSDLPHQDYHWVTSDLNLNPNQSIKEVLRLCSNIPKVKGIFMTIKMVKSEHVEMIPKFKQKFVQAGFARIKMAQLSSHKREFLLYAVR